ncbi:MAG: sigma-E processing peptidase SpoIIGA [Oscillospiraceae bacterium]|nr:sigma-E processing peptidase SpoIIGA [Oscillospiraceae bacterium]
MVVYADVLVAINYFVSYAMLCAAGRIAGVPLGRRGRVRGALVGGVVSLAVFLPLQGFVFEVVVRILSASAMLLAAWPGRCRRDYLRLGIILLCISFLFAGAAMALCLIWPRGPIRCPGGMIYFHVSPLLLLVSVTVAYLLLGFTRRIYGEEKTKQLICRAVISRGDKTAEMNLMCDSGNRLVEPFSGLSVAVCTLRAALPLLTPDETAWMAAGMPEEKLPQGIRLVPYRSVGSMGMLPSFRPDGFDLITKDGERYDCSVWLAVNRGEMPGCDGVFDPALLQLRI